MIYAYTIGYVENVEATIAFYEKAFGFTKKFITPEKDYGELITGETTLAFGAIALGNANLKKGMEKASIFKKAFGLEMAFTTEAIEKDFQKALDAGAVLYEPISEKPWGQKVGYLQDINGFLIEICTPIQSQ